MAKERMGIFNKKDRIVVIFVIALILGIPVPSVAMQYVRGVHDSELKTAATFPYGGSGSNTNISNISYIGAELSENNLSATASNSTIVDETQSNSRQRW
jgi:hypothetical protein